MANFHRLEFVARRFEQAHEHRDAHVAFRDRLHAGDGGTGDARATRELGLRPVESRTSRCRLDDVRFTPAYNIVTSQAYPRYATNAPGLSIEGRKTWAPGKSLEQFFKTRLGIAPRDYTRMAERVSESAVEVGREIIEAAKNDARWRGISKQMLHVWNDGMTSLRHVKGKARQGN